MTEETVNAITQYITAEILKQPGKPLAADAKLLSSGLIDSFSLVDLAMFIDERFHVRIHDTELNAQTFDSVAELAALVEKRKK